MQGTNVLIKRSLIKRNADGGDNVFGLRSPKTSMIAHVQPWLGLAERVLLVKVSRVQSFWRAFWQGASVFKMCGCFTQQFKS